MNTSNFDTKQRFGFRKHRWAKGLASVLLGLSFVGVGSVVTGTNTVHADELGKADQAKASLQEARDQANSGSSTQTLGLNKVPSSSLRVQRFANPAANEPDIEISYDSDGNPIIPSQPGHPGDNYNYNVNYDADEHHTTIHYKDAQGHEVSHKDVSGYTDQTVRPGTSDSNTGADDKNATYDPNLPDGWKRKDGQDQPDISFSGNPTGVDDAGQQDSNSHNAQDEAGYNVSIEHNSGKLDHTKPGQDIPKPGDTIPGSKGNRFTEDPNNPGKVAGLTDKELDKTISETIDIDVPEGYPKPASKTDSVQFSRGAKVDSVDGHVIEYGAWTASDGKNGKLADQTIDGIAGYVINVDGKGVGAGEGAAYTIVGPTVTGADGNIHHTVTYVAQGKVKTVDIVDKTDSSQNRSFTLKGNTDQTLMPSDSGMHLVDGLEFVSDADRDAYNNLKNNGYKLTADDTSQATNNHIVINVQHKKVTITQDKDIPADATNRDGGTTKNITRTITVKTPNHDDRTTTDKTDTQTVTFTRTGTYDAVTKAIAWNNYASDHPQFDEYTITAIPGYNVSVTKGDASELASDGSKLNAKTITSDAQNEALTVEYKGTAHTVDYSFVDDKDGNKEVGHAQAGGLTDQTIDLSKVDGFKIPAGYKAAENQVIPPTVKLSMDNPDLGKTVVIYLTHDTRTIVPGKDITPGQTIPGDHSQPGDDKPNRAISYDDLHKELDRTITVNDPHTGAHTTTDKISFERTATIDSMNGAVSFGAWTPVDPAKNSFTEFDAPAVDGYTPSVTNVDGKTFTTNDDVDHWSDPNVKIDYTAKDAHQDYIFKDTDGKVIGENGEEVPTGQTTSTTVTGKTDGDITKPPVPAGWEIVGGGEIGGPTKFAPDDTSTPVEVTIQHSNTVINPDDPKVKDPGDKISGNPDKKPGDGTPKTDISYDKLNTTITRTVTATDPKGAKTDLSQSIVYHRTATIDNVTGAVSFGDWTPVDPAKNSFTDVVVPTVPGYTPEYKKGSADDLKAETPTQDQINKWTDPDVQIGYIANNASKSYKFVGDGKVINQDGTTNDDKNAVTITVNGKTDEDIPTVNVPTGWKLVNGQTIQGGKFTPDENDTQTIQIEHKILVIDPKNPQKTGTLIPGSVGGKTYNHVEDSDLNSKATRQIIFNWPNGKVPTTLPEGFHLDKDSTKIVTQTIRFERYAHIDLVTGKVTYYDKNGQPAHDGNDNEPWDSDPNPAKFPALVIPKVAGYKAKVSLVKNERTVDKHGLVRMYQRFAVNFMALPASVPGDHTIGHEPVDPTKGDDGHKVAPKPGDTIITDDKGGTRVIPGDTDPNKDQDHGTTNPDNPNKGKDEGNKGQDHGTTNPDNPNKGEDEGNKGQDHGTTSSDKPNKGNDEGNKGKDEGSTTPVVPTTPSDNNKPVDNSKPVDNNKPADDNKPVDNSNNKGTENTKKTSKKNKKSAKDANKVTREAKEKQREEMRKHPSSTGVGSNDGVLGSPLMGNHGPVAPTQDQAHMAPEVSPSATVQAATLGTHAAVSNSNNLPQTGEAASKLGLIGLAFASLGGMVALAGTRKRRED